MAAGFVVLGSKSMPIHRVPGAIPSLMPLRLMRPLPVRVMLMLLGEDGRLLSIFCVRPRGSDIGIGSSSGSSRGRGREVTV